MKELPEYTRDEKISELAREIAMRRNVFVGQVRAGKMTQAESDKRIGIMEAILADIKRLKQQRLAQVTCRPV